MSNKRTRKANGLGSIRKKVIRKNDKTYISWEGRVTVGYDEHGRQLARSVSGKTQKEVTEKVKQLLRELSEGKLVSVSGFTVRDWMDKWGREMLNHVAAGTAHEYRRKAELYINPALGDVKLQKLSSLQIQDFINTLFNRNDGKKLSPKTIKDIHGVLHRALESAVEMKLLASNPADHTSLPKVDQISRDHYDLPEIMAFLKAIENHIHERYYLLLLLTGMREAEALGLTWKCIDFYNRTIHVKQQLQRNRDTGIYELVVPKRQEIRELPMGEELFSLLKEQQSAEKEKRKKCGNCWQNKNLVFSNPTGGFLSYRTVFDCYKRVVKKIGLPEMRVHDLRHAYTMLALRNGDDVKTVQSQLGHKTPDFTLDVYAYTTHSLKQQSGSRMDERLRKLKEGITHEKESG